MNIAQEIEIFENYWHDKLLGTDYWSLYRHALSSSKNRYGHWLLSQNRIPDARKMMTQAITHYKWDPHNWWGWCKAQMCGRR